jgi:hypothetical protein
MRFVRRLASAAAVLLAAGLLLAPAAAADPGFSTRPRVVDHAPGGSGSLVDLRVGRHPGFDRVVFVVDGPLPWYSIRYVPVVRLDGSGHRLPLRGSAFLEVVVRAPTHDDDGVPVLATTRLRPDFPALREVSAPGSFEGQTVAGVGVTRQVGFRVFELTGPNRIVLDLAHPAAAGQAGDPATGGSADDPADDDPAAAGDPPGQLPFTGDRTPLLLGAAAGLLAAGAALLALVRRRPLGAR